MNRSDLLCYVAYVLLDEASRPSSGKRQKLPMRGFWISRQGKIRMVRGSDAALRHACCIDALKSIGGKSISAAAAQVADALGRGKEVQVERLRVEFYDQQKKVSRHREFFATQFLEWRAWVLESGQQQIEFALKRYGRMFGRRRRDRLAKLIAELRSDAGQLARSREWLLRPEPKPKIV